MFGKQLTEFKDEYYTDNMLRKFGVLVSDFRDGDFQDLSSDFVVRIGIANNEIYPVTTPKTQDFATQSNKAHSKGPAVRDPLNIAGY